jgi:predicted nucleotidyltransferase
MVKVKDITAFAHRVAKEFSPDQIILFGSHAYGKPTADSDVDLLVILPFEGDSARKAIEIRRRVTPTFGLDLLVRTPEVMKWRLEQGDFFLREVMEKGKVLYEAVDRRVGRKGRERLR